MNCNFKEKQIIHFTTEASVSFLAVCADILIEVVASELAGVREGVVWPRTGTGIARDAPFWVAVEAGRALLTMIAHSVSSTVLQSVQSTVTKVNHSLCDHQFAITEEQID